MSKYSKYGVVARCGSADSKYTGRPNGLDENVAAKELEHNTCKQKIKDIVLSNPSKMGLRYWDVIEALKELKEEYRL